MGDSPHPQAAIAALLQAAFGAQSAQVLYVAAKLGFADLIRHGHESPVEIAAVVKGDAAAVRRILRGLVALGVCTESPDGKFRLTALGEFLRSDHPDSVQSRIILNGDVHYELWADILATVHTGESASQRVFGAPFYDHLVRNPEVGAVFDRAMTSTGGVRYRFRPAVEAYDFGTFDRVIDVGGGNGTLMVELLTKYPRPHGTIFDVSRLAEAARKRIEAAGLAARCDFVAGDAFASVPSGADAYVLSNFLINWGDEESLIPLRNCRRAMAPEGKLLLVEWVMPTGNASTPGFRYWDTVMMDLVMLAAFGSRSGYVRTRAEFDALLAAAGFRLTTVVPTAASVCVMEAVPVGAARSGREPSPSLPRADMPATGQPTASATAHSGEGRRAPRVSLAEVVEVLEIAAEEFSSYLHVTTGRIITVSDEDLRYAEDDAPEDALPEWQRQSVAEAKQVLESRDWLRLPGKVEIHEWALMQDFGRSLPTPAQREDVGDAIHRRGAFGNFKRTIRRLGVEDAWYAFRDRALEDIARGWLEGHHLEFDDDRARRRQGRGHVE